MRIMILGSGVIGVTSAYYLARAGHDVTVIDRHPDAALGTSFANAGQISPGYATPWATPGLPFKVIKLLTQQYAPLHLSLDGSLFQFRWLLQLLQNCTPSHYARNKFCMVKLAEYSRACLMALRTETVIRYEGRQRGTLQVFRTQQQFKQAAKDIAVLQQLHVPYELLSSSNALLDIEPALNTTRCIGGLHLPDDETGDCFLFTRQLAQLAAALGVRFLYNTSIDKLLIENHQIQGVVCDKDVLQADQYVVALGAESTLLLRGILALPVYPIKGYSITSPITQADQAPLSTILDETYKVAITRFDSRIRVGGIAEMAGYDHTLNLKRRQTLMMVINQLFPHAYDPAHVDFWTGLRAMTPTGIPLIGKTAFPNLYVNTGHGTLGWTMACGSAQLLADVISDQPTALDASDYAMTVSNSMRS